MLRAWDTGWDFHLKFPVYESLIGRESPRDSVGSKHWKSIDRLRYTHCMRIVGVVRGSNGSSCPPRPVLGHHRMSEAREETRFEWMTFGSKYPHEIPFTESRDDEREDYRKSEDGKQNCFSSGVAAGSGLVLKVTIFGPLEEQKMTDGSEGKGMKSWVFNQLTKKESEGQLVINSDRFVTSADADCTRFHGFERKNFEGDRKGWRREWHLIVCLCKRWFSIVNFTTVSA